MKSTLKTLVSRVARGVVAASLVAGLATACGGGGGEAPASPEASPAASPEASPAASPEASPAASPEASPAASPSPTTTP
ncbi:hypothetical protein [Limnothrix redekei]|uniref:Uncharacterized protein n=1 Tax=Limnothrix redekei LRLZ20PSL1 TaxID=3112953 RepID=A0ABW7CB40_9CYAN